MPSNSSIYRAGYHNFVIIYHYCWFSTRKTSLKRNIKISNFIISVADGYKPFHYAVYPKNTEQVYCYFESCGCSDEDHPQDGNIFFGLQGILKKYFSKPITKDDVDYAHNFYGNYFGNPNVFNRSFWDYIVDAHGGHLLIVIKAVREGTYVPLKNVLFTVENTDLACYWLPAYIESVLVQTWYPTAVATYSFAIRKMFVNHLVILEGKQNK